MTHAAFSRAIATLIAMLVPAIATSAQAPGASDTDALYREFLTPPATARPRVWWHWIDGNITKEGMTKDIEWMKRVGIGGFQNFDVSLRMPTVVNERLSYMSAPWTDALRHAVDLADANDLEMAIATSPGWSETGGPWVKPAHAMKKLVWSELEVEGGKPFTGKLPQPPSVIGPFQDVPLSANVLGPPQPREPFYADAKVVAFPISARPTSPRISATTGEAIDAALLSDGALATSIKLKFGSEAAPACVVFDYGRATAIASLLLGTPVGSDFFHSPLSLSRLEASDDGTSFRKLMDLPSGGIAQHTVTFAPVSARYFRVCFTPPPPPYTDLLEAPAPGAARLSLGAQKPVESVEIGELRLFTTARIHRAEEKAGFAHASDYYAIDTPRLPADHATPAGKVIDLTDRLRADGTLDWCPPPGRWKVMRFGYSLTGKENAPANREATGLEVDKLDREYVREYLDTYLSMYEGAVGKERLGDRGIRALLADSIEVGAQNWTRSLPDEFRKRRGYDLTPWMPALAGVIVESTEASDRFLYDFRRTIGDLLTEHHYAQIAEVARARGLTYYGEAFEQGRPVLGDDIDMRRFTDVPMSAIWTFRLESGARPSHVADIRGAASVAHIYGQNLVAAESLTSSFAPWAHSPRDLKPMIDLAFVHGLNRPVIHTSVHQPLIGKAPGLSLLIFGQYFNRNETWAEQAGAWVSYLARTSRLLQEGKFVADVAYFYGEEAPLTALYRERYASDVPQSVGYDFANADVVMNRLRVDRGDLVTETGMRYRVLYLGGTSSRMTLTVLKRIAALVRDGATVVGEKPIGTPSLADDANEFAALADALWSGETGKGRIIASRDIEAALASLRIAPDFAYSKPQPDSEVMFLHRRVQDGDIYFLTNRRGREERIEATFRVEGKRPEIWRAETGAREPVAYRIEDGRTIVPLTLAPHDAVFVVFREPAAKTVASVTAPVVRPLATLDGEWQVSFQSPLGEPAISKTLPTGSWAESQDPAIRYFSGTATYTRNLDVPQAWRRGDGRVVLDLGDVRELAEVVVNGRSMGVVWHPPYRVDITDALKRGANRLEIRVTNLWVNRLIGAAQPNAAKRTFTALPTYEPDAPLRASGLLGPVIVNRVETPRGE